MKLPIFIKDESCYIDVHTTLEEAVCSMEAIDVLNGTYKGYDSNGQKLSITVDSENKIKITESKIDESLEFRKDLIAHLNSLDNCYSDKSFSQSTLEDIVIEVMRVQFTFSRDSFWNTLKRKISNLKIDNK